MSLPRTLTRFLFLSAINHQVTFTLVEGTIFDGLREKVGGLHPQARKFVHCSLCVGTWVGGLLTIAFRPQLLEDVTQDSPSLWHRGVNLVGDAFLLALGGRVYNEALGWLRREVQVKQKEVQFKEKQVDGTVLPESFPGLAR